jgi:hypothetical protein
VRNYKFAIKSATTEAGEKVIADLELFNFSNFLMHIWVNKKQEILLNKISHRFLMTTNLFTR